MIYDTVFGSAEPLEAPRTKSGGAAVPIADYLTDDDVFTYTAPSTSALGPSTSTFPSTSTRTRDGSSGGLIDDIVLRNTLRQ